MYIPRDGKTFGAASFRALLNSLSLLTLVSLAGTALAYDGPKPLDSYRLAPGDRIVVSVFGEPDLSGDHLIDASGNIYVPLVGAVRVAELTVAESEGRIVARLSDGVLRQPFVNVRIGDLRPIYVVGDVKSPGSYPYRPGASVLSAVALAGGFGVVESEEGRAISELLLSEQQLAMLEQTRRRLLVKKARLEVQLKGGRTFQAEGVAEAAKSQGELTPFVDDERETLEVQIKTLDKEIEFLNRQKPRVQKEIEAVQSQIRFENKQLDLIQQRLDDHYRLLTKELVLKSTGLELEREKARNQGNISKYGADIARLELWLGEIDIKIQDARNAYTRSVLSELQATRAKLHEVDSTIPSAREIRAVKLELFQHTAGALPVGALRQISIVRARGRQAELLRAVEATVIEPGDVIQVTIPRREPRLPPLLQELPKGGLRDVTAAAPKNGVQTAK